MTSSSQRRVCLVSLDRLTSLPTEIINIILMSMPIRDVVRTSALSKFWRYKWMNIPDLVFDACSLPLSVEARRSTKRVDLVNHVLFLHNGNISRFEISNYLNRYCPDVDRWIYLLARKQVKELNLMFPSGDRYKLSSSLIFCQSLRRLQLQRCILNSSSGFCKLVELDLREVTFSNVTIASLIFNSPLQKLFLHYCDGLTRLNIYAPNLRRFYIHGPCANINFGNTPKLAYAHMGLLPLVGQVPIPIHNHRKCKLEDALSGLVHVEGLKVYKHFMEILAACTVPGRLFVPFSRLGSVFLEIDLTDSKEISTIICLLRSSPCLQAMEIMSCSNIELMQSNEGESSEVELYREGAIFPMLETVELTGFKGTQLEMRFVQFILLHAVVLQTMSLKWEVSSILNAQRKVHLLENMMQFERASPRAKVTFLS